MTSKIRNSLLVLYIYSFSLVVMVWLIRGSTSPSAALSGLHGRRSVLMKSDEEWCRMIQHSSYLTKCREGSPHLINAPSRRCLVCRIDKPLTADNFQMVPSFQEGFSYYCNNCDPESRKQKTITREEFNLFLKMKRKSRWQEKLVILSWLFLFYSIFLGGMVWFPRRQVRHGWCADAEWCRVMQ